MKSFSHRGCLKTHSTLVLLSIKLPDFSVAGFLTAPLPSCLDKWSLSTFIPTLWKSWSSGLRSGWSPKRSGLSMKSGHREASERLVLCGQSTLVATGGGLLCHDTAKHGHSF